MEQARQAMETTADYERTTPPTNGAARPPSRTPKRRTRGARAAANRATRLRADLGQLPAHKDALLGVTARLLVHFENASDRLYRDGELTADGDVRALLPRVLDLARMVRENVVYLDGDSDIDPFGPTNGGAR